MRTFRSAIDTWFWVVLVCSDVALVVAFVMTLASGSTEGVVIVAVVSVVAMGLPLWLAFSTTYTVDANELLIRSGPFRWRVPLAEIESVAPSRSVLSSPALSLDRLEIRYSGGRSVLVSPVEKDAFTRAVLRQD